MYRAAIIRPGVYSPGGGPWRGKRVAITEQFIRNAAHSLEGEPVNIGHSRDMQDEVGFHRNVEVEEDDHGLVLRADLVIQADRPKFTDVVGFIEGRLEAGDVPEYSMELPHDSLEWVECSAGESYQGEVCDIRVTDGEFIGGAILTQGACSAEDGCGIGLSQHHDDRHFFCPCESEFVVPDTPDVGFTTDAWSKPALDDFAASRGKESTTLSEWTDQDLRWLAGHYMWAEAPVADLEQFNQLKLPYRRPSGPINVNALRAILSTLGGARGGVEGIPAGERQRIERRARALLERGNEATEASAADHTTLPTTLSGTSRRGTTMSDTDETTEDPSGTELDRLREEREQLEAELEEARSQLESKDEREDELENELEAKTAKQRELLRERLEELKGEDYVEDALGEDPSLERLETAVDLVEAEHDTSEGEDADPEDAERQTDAQRTSSETLIAANGEKVPVDAYNALRETFGLDPIEPGERDPHPQLASVFKRAKRHPRGEAKHIEVSV